VAVPVEGAVEAQPRRGHRHRRDQHRAEPSAGAADQQPEAPQGHPTIVAFSGFRAAECRAAAADSPESEPGAAVIPEGVDGALSW
jgi:hypothetical protein